MSEQDPMKAPAPAMKPLQASPERAAEQVAHPAWPVPGDEGYVHPDGTPQAATQLVENQRAAADRAAAQSIVHGAPGVERGGRPDATEVALDRARQYGGPSNDARDAEVTRTVVEGQQKTADATTEALAPQGAQRSGGAVTTDPKQKSER